MANELLIPFLNPLHFVPVSPNINPAYNTKYFDDYLFRETLFPFQEKQCFYLTYQKSTDTLRFQFTSNFSPLFCELIDQYGNSLTQANASPIRENYYEPGSFIYELTQVFGGVDVSDPNAGFYLKLTPGGNASAAMRSEWFKITDGKVENSIYMEYFNKRYHGDVIFETGITFALRIPGYIEFNAPSSKDVLYADQVLDQTQLSSRPQRNATLWVGDGGGVPNWLIDKINWAFSCSSVMFDGVLWAKADSAKWAESAQEGGALKGYSIGIVPGINRASRIVNPSIDPNKRVTVVYNIGSNVFGSVDNQGGLVTTPLTGTE